MEGKHRNEKGMKVGKGKRGGGRAEKARSLGNRQQGSRAVPGALGLSPSPHPSTTHSQGNWKSETGSQPHNFLFSEAFTNFKIISK